MEDYTTAYHFASPHGIVVAVHIPDSPDPVSEPVLERLHPEEAALARTLRGYRQVQFAGGRLALREAIRQLQGDPGPLLSTDRGAPIVPDGLTGSVSHKRTLAIGMIARAAEGTLGVDLEEYGPERLAIAPRVLTPEELGHIAHLSGTQRWLQVLLRFSIKESIYKAVDPYVHRYVGFHEATVVPDLYGRAQARLDLKNGEGPFDIDARYEWLHGRLLTSVRLRPANLDPRDRTSDNPPLQTAGQKR